MPLRQEPKISSQSLCAALEPPILRSTDTILNESMSELEILLCNVEAKLAERRAIV